MAAVFEWCEDNGTATGSPAMGTTRTIGRTEQNWKNIDDSTTAYSASPITPGQNSFTKWIFCKFSGTYTSIAAGLWAHTAVAPGTGLTIKGKVNPGSAYSTPAVAANGNLTVDMTSPIAIGSGQAVQFGVTGPEAAGKGASTTANPAYSEYLVTQLQTAANATTVGACVFSIGYDET